MPNIYSQIPEKLQDELFEEIARGAAFKLERIVSQGHSTPEGEWYDQERDEWIILLQGGAGILIEGNDQAVTLRPGDYMRLPAHQKHRVAWTHENVVTIWLALHYQSNTDQSKGKS